MGDKKPNRVLSSARTETRRGGEKVEASELGRMIPCDSENVDVSDFADAGAAVNPDSYFGHDCSDGDFSDSGTACDAPQDYVPSDLFENYQDSFTFCDYWNSCDDYAWGGFDDTPPPA